MVTDCAPIVIFLYNRPDHARNLLASLYKNPEFLKSPLYIYCDAAKHQEHEASVAEVRHVARELAPDHARIVERDINFGLAGSIIDGVSTACAEHGRVIVIEDDLVLSPVALAYFNRALDRYADDERVMHIAGYMYPTEEELPELFFYREATCWGWATWSRAWQHFEPDARRSLMQLRRAGRVDAFNIEGTFKYEKMLYGQWRGRSDSWAIRWYASLFLKGGLSLHPRQALVSNHGLDGSGVHCNATNQYDVILADEVPAEFPELIEESSQALKAMTQYHSRLRDDRRSEKKTKTLSKKLSNLHYKLRLPI